MLKGTILQTKAEIEAGRIPYSPLGENEASGASDSTPSIVISRERQPELGRKPEATASPHGMTPAELNRFSAGSHFLGRQGAAMIVTQSCCGASEAEMARRARDLKSDIAKYQRDAGIEDGALWVEIRESTPEPHAAIISVWPTARHRNDAIRKLRNGRHSEQIWFGDKRGRQPQNASDLWGLVGYLAKEATPQAWYSRNRSFYHLPKSKRAAPISGDRVRLSKSLKAELIRRGDIEPYKGTNIARVNGGLRRAGVVVQQVGGAVTSSCLNHASGEQLALFPDAPVIDFLAAAEAHRKDLGISQREAAKRTFIRQSHWSNALVRHHDPVGPWVLNRLREFVADDRIAA